MAAVTGAMSTVTDLVGSVFTAMTGNEFLVVFLAASMLGVGVSVFQRLRGAVG